MSFSPGSGDAASTLQFAVRLFSSLLLGAAVGLEREWRQRMAGTRTNALVAAGAAAFAMAGSLLTDDHSATGRIASYIVSGIGFLGAGIIFKDAGAVRGLNTAATVWCSAAIGILGGFGALDRALLLAIAVLLTNTVFRPLQYRLHPGLPKAESSLLYHLSFTTLGSEEAHVRANLLAMLNTLPDAALQAIHSEDIEGSDRSRIRAEIAMSRSDNVAVEKIVGQVSMQPGVSGLSWSLVPQPME